MRAPPTKVFLPSQFIYRNQKRFSKQYKRMILWLLLRIVNDLRLLRSFTNHATDWDGTTFIKNPFNPLNNGFISTNNGSSPSFVFNQYQTQAEEAVAKRLEMIPSR